MYMSQHTKRKGAVEDQQLRALLLALVIPVSSHEPATFPGGRTATFAGGRPEPRPSPSFHLVPLEQKLLKGHLPRVIYHQVY